MVVRRRESVGTEGGSILNRDYLIEALSRIESMYKSRSYICWYADPSMKEVANHRVDIDLHIFERDSSISAAWGRQETRPRGTTTRELR
jgi:outer membrane protein assembly factor BamA